MVGGWRMSGISEATAIESGSINKEIAERENGARKQSLFQL